MAIKEKFLDLIREISGRNRKEEATSKIDQMMEKLPSHLTFMAGGGLTSISEFLQIEDDLKSRFMDYEDMNDLPELSSALDIYCLTGDTLVRTVKGPVPIRELASKGGEHLVYSYDLESNSVVIGKAINARCTIKGAKIWRVILDDGRVIRATANHPFLLRGGNYVRVDALKPGDEVMPFSSRLGRNGYMEIFQPGWGTSEAKRWQPNYQVIGKFKYGRSTKRNEHVHHVDFDKFNDSPDNLEYLTKGEHAAKHSSQGGYSVVWTEGMRQQASLRMRGNQYSKGNVLSEETRAKMGVAHKGTTQSKEWVRKRTDVRRIGQSTMMSIRSLLEVGKCPAEISKTVGCSWSTAMRYSRGQGEYNLDRLLVNHRILKIEEAGHEDVYDLEVPGYHNFAVEGIFVHNSDDSTQANTMTNKSVWVEGENQGLVDDMEEMLHKRVNIDEELWGLARNLNMYGGDFEELLVKEGEGVVGLNFLPTPLVRAVVDRTWRVIGYKYHPQGKFTQTTEGDFKSLIAGTRQSAIGEVLFEDWNVAHFKLGSRKRYDIYGSSVLEAARWIWRRLILLEDSMLVYRLTRAAARFIFYIDVGDRPPQDAYNYVTKVKTDFKKKKFVNRSGHLDMRYNPLANDEDMFIATRGGKRSAEVETLQGPIYGAIDDVEYFKDKLYAAIKIPKAYLGFESDISAKALLCLREDTRVPLLDGRTRTLRELSEEYKDGEKFWVYSSDAKGNIVPGLAHRPRITRPNAEMLEVELDNGEKIVATPDHPFMMRDGSFIEARELKAGDSLMPLYRQNVAKGEAGSRTDNYEKILLPNGKSVSTHRIVAEAVYGKVPNGHVVHHRDFNRNNNTPENLTIMESGEHHSFHGKLACVSILTPESKAKAQAKLKVWRKSKEHRELKSVQMKQQWADGDSKLRESHASVDFSEKMSGVMAENWSNPEYRKQKVGEKNNRWRGGANLQHLINVSRSYRCRGIDDLIKWSGYSYLLIHRVLKENAVPYAEFAKEHIQGGYKLCRKGHAGYSMPHCVMNHKVAAVRSLGERYDGWDIAVEQHENFATAAGVFVHNSQEDIRFSRTVLRIQRELRNGIKQICKVHLAAKGIDPFDVDYDVMMTVPSAIFEQSYLETLKVRAEVADKLQEFISMPWILKNIFHFSEAEVFEMEQMKNKVDKASEPTLDLSQIPAGAGIEVPIPEGADINQQILLAIKNSGVSPKQFLSDRIGLGVAQDKLDKALARSYGEKGSSDKLLDKMNAMEKGQGGMSKKLKELSSLLGELRHAMHKTYKSH